VKTETEVADEQAGFRQGRGQKTKSLSKEIATGPIFTKLSPLVGGYLVVVPIWPPFSNDLRGPILGSKWTELDYSPLFVALAFRNGLQYRPCDFKTFIYDDLAMLCVNLLNFGPVTPEFNIAKCVQPLVSSFKTNLSDKLSQDSLEHFSPHFTVW